MQGEREFLKGHHCHFIQLLLQDNLCVVVVVGGGGPGGRGRGGNERGGEKDLFVCLLFCV
jgi:hypothetical protein